MRIEIAPRSVLWSLLLVLLVFTLWRLQTLLLSLALAYTIACGFRPLVQKVAAYTALSYRFSAALTFSTFFFLFCYLSFLLFGSFLIQSVTLLKNFPLLITSSLGRISEFGISVDTASFYQNFLPSIEGSAKYLISLSLDSISGFLSILGVLLLSFFILIEGERAVVFLSSLFPAQQDKIRNIEVKTAQRIGVWVLGQFFVAGLTGLLIFVGFSLLGLDYALPLSILAAVLTPVLVLGPLIALVPALVVAFFQDPVLALWVFLFYNAIQALKDNFLVPKLLNKTIGLDPMLTILSVFIGVVLFGFIGAIVSIPVYIAIAGFFEEKSHTAQAA